VQHQAKRFPCMLLVHCCRDQPGGGGGGGLALQCRTLNEEEEEEEGEKEEELLCRGDSGIPRRPNGKRGTGSLKLLL